MPPKKGKKMDLGSFLTNDVGDGDWNDDIDLPSAPASTYDTHALPTGPKRTSEYSSMGGGMSGMERGAGYGSGRGAGAPFDPASVPFEAPFTAFIGNLSYDVTEHELETFFGSEIRIKSVRFIMDLATNRPKGYGYVEFLDRDSLIGAVQMDGESLQKRSVRINVAEQKARPGRSGGFEDSKFQGNWRSKAAELPPRQTNPFGGNRRGEGDRPPHAGGWAAGFQKRDESRPFQRREPVAAAAEPIKPKEPKENPFGNAAPRDEEAIQKQIEERRLAREQERIAAAAKEKAEKERVEKEKVAAAEQAMQNANVSDKNAQAKPKQQREVVPDNVPSGAGSWRRSQGTAKPAGGSKKPPFRRNSASEKGSIASIPGEPASSEGGFTKFNSNKKDGKKSNTVKKEFVRRDKDGPSPTASSTKSDIKSPSNAFELLNED